MRVHDETAGCKVTVRSVGTKDVREDAVLIERARRGDLNAFGLLVEPHLGKLLKIILNITKNREDAEDSMQETLLKSFTRLDQFKGTSRFSTWLISIGVNHALMCLRSRHRRIVSFDTVEQSDSASVPMDIPETRLNPEQHYRNKELAETLSHVIETLPSNFRTVFELRYVHEFSNEQAAMVLGTSIAAVKTRSLRARRLLSERLTQRWESHARSSATSTEAR